MSQWYEIWGDPDRTVISMIQTKVWKDVHRKIFDEFAEVWLGAFRASSWRRAKARFTKWKRQNGYPV